jgi:hypothetical protein
MFDVTISGGGGINKFVIFIDVGVNITITDFNTTSDALDLTHFIQIYSLADLTITKGSAIVNLPSSQKVILQNLSPGDLAPSNFVFKDVLNASVPSPMDLDVLPAPVEHTKNHTSLIVGAILGSVAGIAALGLAAGCILYAKTKGLFFWAQQTDAQPKGTEDSIKVEKSTPESKREPTVLCDTSIDPLAVSVLTEGIDALLPIQQATSLSHHDSVGIPIDKDSTTMGYQPQGGSNAQNPRQETGRLLDLQAVTSLPQYETVPASGIGSRAGFLATTVRNQLRRNSDVQHVGLVSEVVLTLCDVEEFDGDAEEAPAGSSSIAKASGGYWVGYYPSAIDTLLPLRLAVQEVAIHKTIVIDENSGMSDTLTCSTGRTALPIVYRMASGKKHWFGGLVDIDSKSIGVTYIDPENNPIPSAVEASLSSALPVGAVVSFAQRFVSKQSYSNNCGPRLIEAFAEIITGASVSDDLAPHLHSHLLAIALREEAGYILPSPRDMDAFRFMLDRYGIDIPTYAALSDRGFRKVALRLHPDKGGNAADFAFAQNLRDRLAAEGDIKPIIGKEPTWQPILHKANIAVQTLNVAVTGIELYQVPTSHNAKQTAVSSLHLYSMCSGITQLSVAASTLSVAHTYYEGGIYPAMQQASVVIAYMALPAVLAAASPYAAFAYSVTLGVYTGYQVVSHAYELYQSWNDATYQLESLKAYRDNAQWLHDFTGAEFLKAKVQEYDAQINAMKCGNENLISDELSSSDSGDVWPSHADATIQAVYNITINGQTVDGDLVNVT